jgi:lipid A oxidase
MFRTVFSSLAGAAVLGLLSSAAMADPVLSIYGGVQTAAHSGVDVSDGTHFTSDWEGKSFSMPPYWGVRGTWWLNELGYDNIGISLDYSHSKVYASEATLRKTPGWTHFEFTDGLNLATANVIYRFPGADRAWTPYIGLGAGVNVPHVEVIRPSGKTWDYQLGGPALQAMVGMDYAFTKHISSFVEYKFDYSHVDVDIDSGDTLKTDLLTHAVDIGVSYHF